MSTETNLQEQPAENHLFTEEEMLNYQEASTGQRFLNYLIDVLLMQYGLGILTGMLLAVIINAIDENLAYEMFIEKADTTNMILFFYLLNILNYIIYYTICEKAFKGYTLGKLITGTRAIRQDGMELTFKDAFLRSLSRLVPFEPFSIWFGSGLWHDTWTKTTVVRSR